VKEQIRRIQEGEKGQEREKKQEKQPFEDMVGAIDNAEKWTAAFTIVKIRERHVRTLADTGASKSVISENLIKKLGLEKYIQPSLIRMVDAQKKSILIKGEITVEVLFAGKLFEWKFMIAEKCICPLILGIDIKFWGSISKKERGENRGIETTHHNHIRGNRTALSNGCSKQEGKPL